MDTNEVKTQVSLNVQFVVGGTGEPTAVLVDIETWNRILDMLKEAEDLAATAHDTKRIDPDSWDLEKVGYRTWQTIREELREQLLQDELNAMRSIEQNHDDIIPPRSC